MASAGADWQTNPATQIQWGLGYIKAIYGDPCKAWAFWQVNHDHDDLSRRYHQTSDNDGKMTVPTLSVVDGMRSFIIGVILIVLFAER